MCVFIWMRVDKILVAPLIITQYNSTAPQTAASKMTIKVNQCLPEHNNLYEGRVYCRARVY